MDRKKEGDLSKTTGTVGKAELGLLSWLSGLPSQPEPSETSGRKAGVEPDRDYDRAHPEPSLVIRGAARETDLRLR